MTPAHPLPHPLSALRVPALIIGALGLIATFIWMLIRPEQAFRSYLFGYLPWLGIALGSLAMAMVHQLVGGIWGLLIRRIQEAAAMTLPLLAILFIPIFFGLSHLYPWADHPITSEVVRHRIAYLNPAFFIGRTAFYFLLWIVLAFLFWRWSAAADQHDDLSLQTRLSRICAAGLVLYVLSMTFASVDWILSRQDFYYSTVFGFIVAVGQALIGFAFAILLLSLLSRHSPYAGRLRPRQLNDLSTLLFVMVVLFAYVAFAQFLINWTGNTQPEIRWYVQRTSGGWRWIGAILIIFHFFLPFFVLLSRDAKQQVSIMAAISGLLLVMRLIDLFWMVAPSGIDLHPAMRIYWSDFASLLGVGGIWFAAFLWLAGVRALLPRNAPGLPQTQDHGEEASGSFA